MRFQKYLTIFFAVAYWLPVGILQIWRGIHAKFALIYLVLGVHSLLFGYLLLRRRAEAGTYPWYVQLPIILSIFLGSLFNYDHPAELLKSLPSVIGFLLSIWALVSLGDAAGIAPADRGLVRRGPYQYIRHPMYAGYLISAMPVLMYSPTYWNCTIFGIILVTIVIRILLEERVISDYLTYKQSVHWRIVPFVW
ncbi:MAG: hypothetical protein FJZ87_13005 [Chloroflexi bacterium]|nr:hypothetical protein [Chloroflexota bacterium]